MKLFTAEQMRQADADAISIYHIPGIELMERAGSGAAREILDILHNKISGNHVLILCGKGNNGGDGLVAARYLHEAGCRVSICLAGKIDEAKGDAKINLARAASLGLQIIEIESTLDPFLVSSSDLIVDALLGTGFYGELKEPFDVLVKEINESGKPVVSLDIPSGLNSNTGAIGGDMVHAGWTITFAAPKLGMALLPGSEFVGKIRKVDIGFPAELLDSAQAQANLITRNDVADRLHKRELDSHKGDNGHVFVMAGSVGMTGAAAMSAGSAMRIGAGLVSLGIPSSLNPILETKLTEVMTRPLTESPARSLSLDALPQLTLMLKRFDSVAVGPGLSTYPDTAELVRQFLRKPRVPCVIDADALNALATDSTALLEMKAPKILTPHPGEMARLLGTPVEEVQSNRIAIAVQAAQKFNAVIVLKGARTVVATSSGEVWINIIGNPGMATAGAGDVLTGTIAGLLGQGLSVKDAALCGVYLHALAGDLAAKEIAPIGFLATDIENRLPMARALVEKACSKK